MKAMNKLFVAAVIATSLTACQQESFEVRTDSDNYYASVETFATGTKTVLGENRSVVWSSEDRIAIFEGKDVGQAYQVLDSYVGKSSGEFAEVEGLVTEGTDAAIEGSIAVYPFNEALTVTSGDNGDYVIEGVTFPSEQKYVAGSFSDEAFPMVAVTSDKNLSFKNVGGVLKLSLTGSYSVSSITLTGNSGELLSGPATVTLGPDGIPSVTMSDDASTSVSLVCDPAVELDPEKATDFNISIPPTVFEEGFNISIIDSYGESRGKSTDKLNKVERSKMLVMPELANSDYAYIDLSNNPEWETGIIAEDGRYLLVKKDTTNNGYISYINSSAFDSDGIVLYYDKNIELLSFVTNKGACYINREADNADIILVLDDESHIYENITLNTIEIAMTKAAPVVPIIVGVATGIATVKNIWDTVQATKELNDGNWDGARLDYLKLLGGTAAKNPFGGFVIDGAFGVLDKAKKDLDMKGQTCFLGNCQILMKQTKIGLKKFRIDVTVTGYETLPIISKITGEKSVVFGGIAVAKTPYVTINSNDQIIQDWIINGNGTNSVEFELPEDQTYYAIPYILPTRGGKYEFKSGIRYGNTIELPYFPGIIDEFTQLSYTENNNKYTFKCSAHAICNPAYEDDHWRLYYEDDNGNTEFYYSKTYDVPSISTQNSAEFEFEIELDADKFIDGKKEIKLGIDIYAQYGIRIPSSPQLFELSLKDDRWVDLGLSVLWAAYNVGASSPEEYGGYYAWGETSTKSDYTDENYKYYEKYYYGDEPDDWYWVGKFIGNEISGTSYDVAHVQWGGGARMPTRAEVQELEDNCTFTGGSYNGVRGSYVTGPNGNSIFLPFAGIRNLGGLYPEGVCGCFWSGTYCGDDFHGKYAFHLICDEDYGGWSNKPRLHGLSVRPVTEK